MIRVAQMMLAQALRAYLRAVGAQVDLYYILSAFLDSEEKPKYTIDRFLGLAGKFYYKQAGDWFSVTEAALIVQELHGSTPLKGAEHLSILLYDGSISIAEVASHLEQPKHLNKFLKDKPLARSQSRQSRLEPDKMVLLIVTCRLGRGKGGLDDYGMLLDLMGQSSFCGCLGGAPGRARYLTGRNGSEVSYLDPHFVETEVNKMNLEKEISKFQCKDYRLMGLGELDNDVAICYLVRNQADLQALKEAIMQLGQRHHSGLVVCAEGGRLGEKAWLEPEGRTKGEEEDWENLSNGSMESSFFMD
jgi:hypothetical protein